MVVRQFIVQHSSVHSLLNKTQTRTPLDGDIKYHGLICFLFCFAVAVFLSVLYLLTVEATNTENPKLPPLVISLHCITHPRCRGKNGHEIKAKTRRCPLAAWMTKCCGTERKKREPNKNSPIAKRVWKVRKSRKRGILLCTVGATSGCWRASDRNTDGICIDCAVRGADGVPYSHCPHCPTSGHCMGHVRLLSNCNGA